MALQLAGRRVPEFEGAVEGVGEEVLPVVQGLRDEDRLMHTADMFKAWATLTDCVRAGTAVRSIGRARKESEDVARASESLQALEQQRADLESQFQAEAASIRSLLDPAAEPLETIAIRPKKTGIAVRLVALAWGSIGNLPSACTSGRRWRWSVSIRISWTSWRHSSASTLSKQGIGRKRRSICCGPATWWKWSRRVEIGM
jgi:hypothetical protein